MYYGAMLRLYADGRQVSGPAANGTLQLSRDPLWIGGISPYGQHIDEVYLRRPRLRPSASRRRRDPGPHGQAGRPRRRSCGGLFVPSAGVRLRGRGSSGERNTGADQGRDVDESQHGRALRFDGAGAVVSVPTVRVAAKSRAR